VSDDDPHKEFLLAALRVASARCKLMDNEITSIGCALRGDMIGPETAVKWITDANLLWLVEPLPDSVGATVLPTVSAEVPDEQA